MLVENNPYPQDVRVRREAESLARAGHHVTVVAPRGPGQPRSETVTGVTVRRFRQPIWGQRVASFLVEYLIGNLALHWAAIRELRRGATVLHLFNPPDTLFPAGALARALGCKVVFDHRDLFPELVLTKFGSRGWASMARLAEQATFAISDLVIAPNESYAEIARRRGGKPNAAIAVVRNGPLTTSIAPDVPGRPGPLRDPHLVYAGTISDQDGVEMLAELLRRLRDEHGIAEPRLTIVGDGDGRPLLAQRLVQARVQDWVEMLGWVELEQVPAYIRCADICVEPAPPNELNEHSTMTKVAEYLAAGKPLVAYRLRETARTVGDAALLASPGDSAEFAALVAVLARQPEEREALAQRARARAPQLTWERSEPSLLKAYAAL